MCFQPFLQQCGSLDSWWSSSYGTQAGDKFQGRPIKGASVKDVLWLNPSGNEISEDEWRDPSLHCLGVFLSGEGVDETDERGRKHRDENFLVLLNAHHEDVGFALPTFRAGARWTA